ncbi:MAG TPA: head GIN domain-containing protein [Kofleriaceae bacterium]|nr:head GIN domain-containing protein [Kofleriaceae bacterium]
MRPASLVLASLASLASVALVACNLADANVKGNGKARTEQRTVPAFDALSLSGAMEVEVTVGGTQSIELSGDENVLPVIRTRVVKGALVVDSKEGYSAKAPLRLRITTPRLASLSSSGASSGTVKGVAGKRFTVDLSGASAFELSGAVDTFAVELSGSGAIQARTLKAPTVSASVSGAGHVELTATSTLSASVSGVGAIDYWGKPGTVNRSVSGVGSIEGH